eukprot:1151106-Pelagomonas_calceolata.AAC.1
MQGQPRHGPGCKGREQLRTCNAKRRSTPIAACTQDQKYPSRPSPMPYFPSWNTAYVRGLCSFLLLGHSLSSDYHQIVRPPSNLHMERCWPQKAPLLCYSANSTTEQEAPGRMYLNNPWVLLDQNWYFLNKKAAKEGDEIRPSPQMAPSHQSHLAIHASNKRYCIHRACQTWKCWTSKLAPNEQQIVLPKTAQMGGQEVRAGGRRPLWVWAWKVRALPACPRCKLASPILHKVAAEYDASTEVTTCCLP